MCRDAICCVSVLVMCLVLFFQNCEEEDDDSPTYPHIRHIERWKPAYMKKVGDATSREAISDI